MKCWGEVPKQIEAWVVIIQSAAEDAAYLKTLLSEGRKHTSNLFESTTSILPPSRPLPLRDYIRILSGQQKKSMERK
eukprot:7843330-Ditylum_brightwellii.AAC.1